MTDPVKPHEKPIGLDELSAALDSGVLTRGLRRAWHAVIAAADQSRVKRVAGDVRANFADEESVFLCAGIVIVTAMAVHLLLLSLQPYPYPGHSTSWLPVALLVSGATLIGLRRPLAAAWRDRAHRR